MMRAEMHSGVLFLKKKRPRPRALMLRSFRCQPKALWYDRPVTLLQIKDKPEEHCMVGKTNTLVMSSGGKRNIQPNLRASGQAKTYHPVT